MTGPFLNLSAYRFVTLDALDALRPRIAGRAEAAGGRSLRCCGSSSWR